VPAQHPPILAWLLTLAAAGVVVWTVRDGLAARRLSSRAAPSGYPARRDVGEVSSLS
jgi:hypothetical protein